MTNAAIDAPMTAAVPPAVIPSHLISAFTYGHKFPVKPYLPDGKVFNQRYLSTSALTPKWNKSLIDDWADDCRLGRLPGTYGKDATQQLMHALSQVNFSGIDVLVIGSENPWVEACLLSLGSDSVTTIEYGGIISEHPKVQTLTPKAVRVDYKSYIERFDAIVTYSSVEHSGLGRYGDEMNPWGDRQAMARAWCMAKPGAKLVIGIPADVSGSDVIYYNAHRSYGRIQLPHLLANWEQLWESDYGAHKIYICQRPNRT